MRRYTTQQKGKRPESFHLALRWRNFHPVWTNAILSRYTAMDWRIIMTTNIFTNQSFHAE
jgi:hypothetical protein